MLNIDITTTIIDNKGNELTSTDFEKTLFEYSEGFIQRKFNKYEEYAKWIQDDIINNLEQGKGLNDKAVSSLKESTIKRKGSSRIFVDKGKLLEGIKMQKINEKDYQIFDSSGEGYFVQTGLNKGNVPREFFGTSDNVIKKILDDLNRME